MHIKNILLNFFTNFNLPREHKWNIKQSKKIIKTIKRISQEENGIAKSIGYLKKIDPYVFEELVLTAYQNKGHRIKRGRSYSGDGGFDGHVQFDKIWYGVQCKRYKGSINPAHVKEFVQITEYGIFVHTGRTGETSKEATVGTNIKFISGQKLIDLITNK